MAPARYWIRPLEGNGVAFYMRSADGNEMSGSVHPAAALDELRDAFVSLYGPLPDPEQRPALGGARR